MGTTRLRFGLAPPARVGQEGGLTCHAVWNGVQSATQRFGMMSVNWFSAVATSACVCDTASTVKPHPQPKRSSAHAEGWAGKEGGRTREGEEREEREPHRRGGERVGVRWEC